MHSTQHRQRREKASAGRIRRAVRAILRRIRSQEERKEAVASRPDHAAVREQNAPASAPSAPLCALRRMARARARKRSGGTGRTSWSRRGRRRGTPSCSSPPPPRFVATAQEETGRNDGMSSDATGESRSKLHPLCGRATLARSLCVSCAEGVRAATVGQPSPHHYRGVRRGDDGVAVGCQGYARLGRLTWREGGRT